MLDVRCCWWFAVRWFLFDLWCSVFVVLRVLIVVCCLLFVVRCCSLRVACCFLCVCVWCVGV